MRKGQFSVQVPFKTSVNEEESAAGGRAEAGLEPNLLWCVYLDGQELNRCLDYLTLKRVIPC